MAAGFRTRPVRALIGLLLLFVALLRALAQEPTDISYDGYRFGQQWISFEDSAQREGELKLLLVAQDENDHLVEEWIRPGDVFLGFSVRLAGNDPTSVFLCPFGKVQAFETQVTRFDPREFTVFSGVFGRPGFPPITAYFGDTYSLGDTKFSLRSLSGTEAVIRVEGESADRRLKLSPTGSLRAEVDNLRTRLRRAENRERRNEEDNSSDLAYLFIFLLFSYNFIFAFILLGMLSLYPFVSITARRHRRRGD